MGTRSLMAYDKGNGNYHVQYLQFDGYPHIKGQEYYNAILRGLEALGRYAVSKKSQRPNQRFFKMVRHFLDDYQYESGHSVGNCFTDDPENFWNCMRDSWEEWKYIWMRNGDFVFFNVYDEGALTYVIPWEFTWNLSGSHELNRAVRAQFDDSDSVLEPFWDSFNKDDPGTLTLEAGKSMAFPEQGDKGYRRYTILRLGEKTLAEDMFSEGPDKRDINVYRTYCFPFRGIFKIPNVSTVHDIAEYVKDKENLPTLLGIDPSMDTWLEKELKAA